MNEYDKNWDWGWASKDQQWRYDDGFQDGMAGKPIQREAHSDEYLKGYDKGYAEYKRINKIL